MLDNDVIDQDDPYAWADPDEDELSDFAGEDDESIEAILQDIEAGVPMSEATMVGTLAVLERVLTKRTAALAERQADLAKVQAENEQRALVTRLSTVFERIGVTGNPRKIAAVFARAHPDFDPDRRGAGHHVAAWLRKYEINLKEV